ncbi:MAG: putative membrane protein [Parcubacteria group bacterium GW2011_GWA2_47_7]|nr:MAG: putative membrane protein [Parcubacteria group bacterium GW2011_GWA2_47_7]
MQNKILYGLYLFGGIFILWLVISSGSGRQGGVTENLAETVRMENGVQIIHIIARGGYRPSNITASAGVATKLEMETKGAYDCSLAFTIPSLGYQKMLPPSGLTLVDIPVQSPGSSLQGLCSMGMYAVNIKFN